MKQRRGEARAVRRDSRPASRPALEQTKTKKQRHEYQFHTNKQKRIIPNIGGVLWLQRLQSINGLPLSTLIHFRKRKDRTRFIMKGH